MRQCAELMGSVNALARQAGIPQSTIRRYFHGGEPNRPHLVAIARAAGVRLDWLAAGSGPMQEGGSGPAGVAETAADSCGGQSDLDILEDIVRKVRRKLLSRGVELRPEAEARVVRLIYEVYLREGGPFGEATLDNVIELVTFR